MDRRQGRHREPPSANLSRAFKSRPLFIYGFYRVLPGFALCRWAYLGFSRVFIESKCIAIDVTRFGWVLSDSTGYRFVGETGGKKSDGDRWRRRRLTFKSGVGRGRTTSRARHRPPNSSRPSSIVVTASHRKTRRMDTEAKPSKTRWRSAKGDQRPERNPVKTR